MTVTLTKPLFLTAIIALSVLYPGSGFAVPDQNGPRAGLTAQQVECLVDKSAIDRVSKSLIRQRPPNIIIHQEVLPIDEIDTDWAQHRLEISGPTPPTGSGTLELSSCAWNQETSKGVRYVEYAVPPSRRGRKCSATDGAWLSRAGFDKQKQTAGLVIVENSCGTDGWYVVLSKASDGSWVSNAPEILWNSLFEPLRPR
jgi:hypothetical protein